MYCTIAPKRRTSCSAHAAGLAQDHDIVNLPTWPQPYLGAISDSVDQYVSTQLFALSVRVFVYATEPLGSFTNTYFDTWTDCTLVHCRAYYSTVGYCLPVLCCRYLT